MLRENFERLNFCTKKNQKQGYWGVVGVTQNKTSPPSSRVWTSAFARQSASFALATTHSQDVLFNASRPYRRSPSAYFEGTHGVRSAWGNTDAIDFVAIASSLQATNGRRAVGNTNRLKAVSLVHGRKNPHSPAHLYYPSSSALAFSPPCGSRSVFERAE